MSEGDEEDAWPGMIHKNVQDGSWRLLIDSCVVGTPTKGATTAIPEAVTKEHAHEQHALAHRRRHNPKRQLQGADEVPISQVSARPVGLCGTSGKVCLTTRMFTMWRRAYSVWPHTPSITPMSHGKSTKCAMLQRRTLGLMCQVTSRSN